MGEENDTQRKVEVGLDEIVELFRFLEDVNRFLHQEMNFTEEKIRAFADRVYPICRRLYYEVVCDWMPEDVMTRLEDEWL